MKLLILALVATYAVAVPLVAKESSSSSSSSEDGGGRTPCDPSPCQNGGVCKIGQLGNYYCKCPAGFYGKNCAQSVKNGCDSSPCQNGGVCENREFSHYYCRCLPGYHGNNCQNAPCAAEPCLNGGVCSNLGAPSGGYRCQCADGFTGADCGGVVPANGYNCGDRNPCARENTIKNGFYFAYAGDKTKFVQCSEWEQCFVMPCGPNTEWDQSVLTCNYPK